MELMEDICRSLFGVLVPVWVNRSTAFPGGGLEMKIYQVSEIFEDPDSPLRFKRDRQ
jgi:hypothetical protein